MSEPLNAEQVADFLRLDKPVQNIEFLDGLILAARFTAENYLNRTITERSRTLVLDVFAPIIDLPFGDVSAIVSIAYVDSDGANQTVSEWILSENRLTPAYGESWPATRAQLGAVTITYTAGYPDINSPPENSTPQNIVQAMYLIIGDMYDNREGLAQGNAYQVNPSQINLMQPDRIDMGV